MMQASDIRQWLSTLHPETYVGIDEGGLTLIAVATDTRSERDKDAYLEVGGTDAIEDDEYEEATS